METASKNYKVDVHNYQIEHFGDLVFSSDPDVIETYRALISHMLVVSSDCHIFLHLIYNPKSNIWYKKSINVSTSSLSKWVSEMAKCAGLISDYTNKNLRATFVSRMTA